MTDNQKIAKLYETLEKVREQKLGEEWQFKLELTILEEKIVAEIKKLRQLQMV